ncbi:hypothetical protein LIER_23072 [Lithospermum erythrorhizon]|uniref:Uncharacterized protein n=1 Tax=Lithospermum erythrorhizon TaxID=34254 RepID=A0AAV3R1S0_LITER
MSSSSSAFVVSDGHQNTIPNHRNNNSRSGRNSSPTSNLCQSYSLPPPWTQWQQWATPLCPYPTTTWSRTPPSTIQTSSNGPNHSSLLASRPQTQQAHFTSRGQTHSNNGSPHTVPAQPLTTSLQAQMHHPTDIQSALHTLSINEPDEQWYMNTGETSHMLMNGGMQFRFSCPHTSPH